MPQAAQAPAAAPAPAAPQSAARAALNAALEAARAGAGQRSAPARPAAPASALVQAPAPTPAAPAASAPAASAARPAPPPAAVASAVRTATAPAKGPAPWEDAPAAPPVSGQPGPAAPRAAVASDASPASNSHDHHHHHETGDDDDLPPWVTEFSDDSAIGIAAAPGATMAAGSAALAPAPAATAPAPVLGRPAPAPAQAPHPQVLVPVASLAWDGDWPAVAAALPLRGVAQQLAVQAELIACVDDGHSPLFRLRVPLDTLRSPANVEKLAAALHERFGRKVQVDTELGPVWYTASVEAQAFREANQRQAEATIEADPFVLSMMRDFGATVVPGSITPAAPTLH